MKIAYTDGFEVGVILKLVDIGGNLTRLESLAHHGVVEDYDYLLASVPDEEEKEANFLNELGIIAGNNPETKILVQNLYFPHSIIKLSNVEKFHPGNCEKEFGKLIAEVERSKVRGYSK